MRVGLRGGPARTPCASGSSALDRGAEGLQLLPRLLEVLAHALDLVGVGVGVRVRVRVRVRSSRVHSTWKLKAS